MKDSNAILDFIEGFKKSHPEEIVELFTQGYCYYFAIILDERFFKSGAIMYNPVYNHFCYKIHGRVYDITGEIVDDDILKDLIPWKKFIKEYDPSERDRVISYSILKTNL